MVRPLLPLVVYVPETWLQSATAVNAPLPSNWIVYFDWSAAGTAPWNAGTLSVIPVSCHVLPARLLPALAPHAVTTSALPMTRAMRMNLRMVAPVVGSRRVSFGPAAAGCGDRPVAEVPVLLEGHRAVVGQRDR